MIEEILDDYKYITEKIISNIDDNEEVLKLMEKREELIKNIFETENNKDSIRDLYLSKDLLKLDEALKNLIINEKSKVREEIENLHKRKSANNAYEKNGNIKNFFNTKI